VSVTVIIPFYNEVENILPLAQELAAVQSKIQDLTALFVDDGSTDGTWQAIQQAAGLHPWIRGLRHASNRGQSAALLNGLRQASGDVIVTMDGDLQNAPADIPAMLERLKQCDVVCGCRSKRGATVSRRWGSAIANRVRQWVTHDGVRDTGCGLKAFRRECISDLPPLSGMHRFMPAYFMLHERRIMQVPVNYRPRQHGVSKYTNLGRLPTTLFDLLGFCWYRSRLLAAKTPAS
jgi:dolichol-phosphate mannosyltransferase